jgi:PPOX class probable F420-dependent enzyme
MQMTPMTPAALDAFYRDRHVAVLAIPRADRPPYMSPVWYDWDGRVFRVQIEPAGAKGKLVGRQPGLQISMTIQSEVPPYRYAVVYGSATLKPNDDPTLRRRIARRYLGWLAGEQFVRDGEKEIADADMRVLEIVPERVSSTDFAPDAGWFGRAYMKVWTRLFPVQA